jgi:hypothetical protein
MQHSPIDWANQGEILLMKLPSPFPGSSEQPAPRHVADPTDLSDFHAPTDFRTVGSVEIARYQHFSPRHGSFSSSLQNGDTMQAG